MGPSILCGERDFADVIKLKWEDYPGLSSWGQCNPKGPREKEAGGEIQKDKVLVRRWRMGALVKEYKLPLEAFGEEMNSPLSL